MAEYVFKALIGENIRMHVKYLFRYLSSHSKGYLENVTANFTS